MKKEVRNGKSKEIERGREVNDGDPNSKILSNNLK
jgi:hypothetical protein